MTKLNNRQAARENMFRNIAVILTLNFGLLFSVYPVLANDARAEKEEERRREIEKAIFIASSTQTRVLKIGLVDCIVYALKNNTEIKIKRLEPKLKEDDIGIARADFEPTLTFDYTLHATTEKSTSTAYPELSKNRDIDFNAGASGKLITGTEYALDFLNERYTSNIPAQRPNPYYTTEPKITITQPLFKGFGITVNKADIVIARNNKSISEESFKDTVIDIVTKTKAAYYNYLLYLGSYTLDKLALERTLDLSLIDKARYQNGLISSVDLLETEAAVAEKQKSLLSAESAVKKAEDELKLVTNLVDDPEVWNARIELIDQPELKQEHTDLLKALENAFGFRPDYQAAKTDLENRKIKIVVAKNSLLPTIDLTGSFGLNGLGKDYPDALKKLDSRYTDWSAGISVSVPWGSADRAKYDQRKLEKLQALLGLKNLEQNIIFEVRDKVREVNISYQQERAAKVSQEKETENYAAQKQRYAAGHISTHDMFDYQDKLSAAELDYLKAVIDYNTALINLDKAQGLTLVKNNVKLEG